MKKYQIGDNRFVVVKNTKDSPTVSIIENGTSKSIDFPFKRWACLTRVFLPQVEEAVKQLEAGQEVKYTLIQKGVSLHPKRWTVFHTSGCKYAP